MKFTQYDLGTLKRGSTVVVTLQGNQANVRLMDSSNFSAYKAGRNHRFHGGRATQSPVRLAVPRDGRWYVAVDMQGLAGTVRSSVNVEPPPLAPLAPIRSAPAPALSPIYESAHPENALPYDERVEATPREWDVFISHATEDKGAVAEPLATALSEHGLRVWLDKTELRIGDSLRRKIDEGLASSSWGVVVLSRPFFAKEWPQYELDGLVTRQNSGEQVILPIWHEITKDEIVRRSPSLADRVALSTATLSIAEIAAQIADVVRRPSDLP